MTIKIKLLHNKFHYPFLLKLIFIKIIASLFAVFVYQRMVSGLGDSTRYLSASFSPTLQSFLDRTLFTDLVFSFIRLFLNEIQSHIFISIVNAILISYLFSQYYKFVNKTLFWSAFLLPHFLVYSGSASKEALVIPAFFLLIKFSVDVALKQKGSLLEFCLGFLISLLMRPNYLIAYLFLIFVTLFIYKARLYEILKFKLDASIFMFLYLTCVTLFILYITQNLWRDSLLSIIELSRNQVFGFVNSNTNRWDIAWYSVSDFFCNLWWGIPVSIIGPTLKETLQRPIFIPVFFEGVISLFLVFFNIINMISIVKSNSRLRMLVIFGFIPAVIIGLLAHYPLGILNPGSALRFKQSLAPLFYFYPLLLTANLKAQSFRVLQSQ